MLYLSILFRYKPVWFGFKDVKPVLYKLGCKGPETYANCPAILFGDVTYGSWPVATGHGCIGCTEQGIVFQKPIYSLAEHQSATPPMAYPRIDEARGQGITPESAALAGAAVGAVIGAGQWLQHEWARRLRKKPKKIRSRAHEST
jgi:Ni,Fe-hydrogenase I small subunit